MTHPRLRRRVFAQLLPLTCLVLFISGLTTAHAMSVGDDVVLVAKKGDSKDPAEKQPYRVIRARVQSRPGGEREDIDMKVHTVPSAIESMQADKAPLEDDDLVLGIVADGKAMAYPIRYLSLYEIVNDQLGETPVAPSW